MSCVLVMTVMQKLSMENRGINLMIDHLLAVSFCDHLVWSQNNSRALVSVVIAFQQAFLQKLTQAV